MDPGVGVDELVAAVEAIGYGAHPPAAAAEHGLAGHDGHDDAGHDEHDHAGDLGVLRRRLLVVGALTIPVVAMAMVPALQFDGWQWVSLALATPWSPGARGPSTAWPCAGRPARQRRHGHA